MDEFPPRLTEPMPTYPPRRAEALEAVLRRLRERDWVRLEGAPELEADLAAYHGGGHPWFIASGTAALEALLLGHEIGPGDEVITTPYTWGATVSAVLAVGAVPVFADIDPRSGLLDPATVEALITSRTRAVLAVHLFGGVADVPALAEIARRHGLRVFEDGSQAHGARLGGRPVGLLGDGGAFSCMGLKLLAGTEGGYALFAAPAARERAGLYGAHPRGMAPEVRARLASEGLLDTLQLGWRPCALSAELVRAHLPHLDAERAARRANAAGLRAALDGCAAVEMPPEPAGEEHGWHLLSLVYHPERTGLAVDAFVARLQALGTGAFRYIPVPVHRMRRLNPEEYQGPRVLWHDHLRRAGVDYRRTSCPRAEWRCARAVEFPFNWTEPNPRAMAQLAAAIRHAAAGGGA